MSDDTGFHYTLLDDLDSRQNDVLAELDALNQRIEELLREFTKAPQRPAAPQEKAA